MLGHQVVNHLLEFDNYDVLDIAYRSKLREKTVIADVTDKAILEKMVIKMNPDFIVNCVGRLIQGSHNVEKAIYLNAYLPHLLKKISKFIDSKLIHISTDCVFSGEKGSYIESDIKDGKGIYSLTKILGEIEDNVNLTLRTSIIGPELKSNGEGLFHWFMTQSGEISGYTKSIWSGVTTTELAKVIRCVIDADITGLYHVTNNSSIDKYNLLKLFKKYTKKNINIIPKEGEKIDKSFVDTRLLLKKNIPSYEQMIKEMVENMKFNNMYSYKM